MSWSGRRMRDRRRREIDDAIVEASGDADAVAALLVAVAGEAAFLLELDAEQALRWEWHLAGTDGLVGEA